MIEGRTASSCRSSGEVHMTIDLFALRCSAGIGVSAGCGKTYSATRRPYQRADLDARWAPVRQLDEEKGVTPTAVNPGYLLTRDIQEHHCLLRCAECHGWTTGVSDGAARRAALHRRAGTPRAAGGPRNISSASYRTARRRRDDRLRRGAIVHTMRTSGTSSSSSRRGSWTSPGHIDLATASRSGRRRGREGTLRKRAPRHQLLPDVHLLHGSDGRRTTSTPRRKPRVPGRGRLRSFPIHAPRPLRILGRRVDAAVNERGWTVDT